MRKLFIIVFFVLSTILQKTQASELVEIYSNDSFENIFSWWYPKNTEQSPIPIYANILSLQNISYNFHNPKYIQTPEQTLVVIDLIIKGKDANVEVTWFDQRGFWAGNIGIPWIYELPPPLIFPLQNNQKLFSISLDNSIKIYNTNGKILKNFKILEDYHFNSENIINAAPFNNNQDFFVSVTQPNLVNKTANIYLSHLLLINSDGDVLLSKKISGWQINSINASEDGKILTAAMHSFNQENNDISFKSIVLNNQLNEILEFEKRHFSSIILSKHSKILFINKQRAYLYDYLNNILSNTFVVKSPDNIYVTGTSFDYSEKIAVLESEVIRKPTNSPSPWAYKKPIMNIIDVLSGKEINSKLFKGITIYKPSLISYNKSDSLLLGHSKGWKQLIIK